MLRTLAIRRNMLVARSAALRGQVATVLEPAALRLAAVHSLVNGLRRALYWALRLAPLYSLLRRR